MIDQAKFVIINYVHSKQPVSRTIVRNALKDDIDGVHDLIDELLRDGQLLGEPTSLYVNEEVFNRV